MQSSVADVDKLKEQIEEERNKFTQIMTNWSQEVSYNKYKCILSCTYYL